MKSIFRAEALVDTDEDEPMNILVPNHNETLVDTDEDEPMNILVPNHNETLLDLV